MISSLCRNNNKTVEILCFKSAASLVSFAADFRTMTGSEIFQEYWRASMDEISRSCPLITLDSIVDVWRNAFQRCQQLVNEIKDQSMKLEDVDRKLHQGKDLETHVLKLHDCLCQCSRISPVKEAKDVRNALGRVRAYWDLRNYHITANVFLKIRDALELTKGDFRDVEKLSNQVPATRALAICCCLCCAFILTS